MERHELERLIERRAPAQDILSSASLCAATAELTAREPTVSAGVIPLRRFWRARRYRDARTFDQLLEHLELKARRFCSGPVARERRLLVVLGPPGAGKSGIAEAFARRLRMALVDADDAKIEIPEYDDGRGSTAVHHESGLLAIFTLARLLKRGENVVLPKIGGSAEMLEHMLELVRGCGYEIVLAHVTVPFDESVRRLAKRYLECGRIVDPAFVSEVGVRSKGSFDRIKQKGVVLGWIEIDGESAEGAPIAQAGVLWPELNGGATVPDRDHRTQ